MELRAGGAHAIETHGLTHRFGAAAAPVLAGIDLAIPAGSLYGFLGPNGAGKTTTLRLVLGLLARQQGSIRLFGRPLERTPERRRVELLRRVGSSIESPSVYAHLTARENLRVWQIVHGCPPRRIDEALARVGLADTGGKRAGDFSLGMKQRLSLALLVAVAAAALGVAAIALRFGARQPAFGRPVEVAGCSSCCPPWPSSTSRRRW